jgi:hypothetical protein
MRTAPGQAPPAATPDSNNRVDPSPYYPVFGRRMVMISYARRLPNLAWRRGRRLFVALRRASNMICQSWSRVRRGAPARPQRARDRGHVDTWTHGTGAQPLLGRPLVPRRELARARPLVTTSATQLTHCYCTTSHCRRRLSGHSARIWVLSAPDIGSTPNNRPAHLRLAPIADPRGRPRGANAADHCRSVISSTTRAL